MLFGVVHPQDAMMNRYPFVTSKAFCLVDSYQPIITQLFDTCCRNAQKKEILKVYRKLAMIWHPDKFEGEEEKKEAEKKFMDIAAAKEVLTDPGGYILLHIYKTNY